MTSLPHPRAALHTPTYTGRHWPSRLYPGHLAHTSQVRTDLTTDLNHLTKVSPETVQDMVLCVSEMFANACDHSRSGQDPEGRVIRTLHMPTTSSIRIGIVDDGTRTDTPHPTSPQIPHQRTEQEWEHAERGRGLLLIHHLATRWGTRSVVEFPFCQGLGTLTWAEFTPNGRAGGQR